jgi:Concanavalin A-like lectin/glucanases superfamily
MVLRSSIPSLALLLPALLLAAAGATGATGCKDQSLFEEGQDEGPGVVGSSCPLGCIGDAARDFDGDGPGLGDRWRYLEDRRDRTWTEMSVVGGTATGYDPAIKISTCKANPTAPACAAVPDGLLLSSSGASSDADPALEFRVPSTGTVQIGVRAFVPETAVGQQILVYRNSREDLLYAGPAVAGELFEQVIVADVLSGDRLLLALAPASRGAAEVGLTLFISDVGVASRCQVALTFEQASGTTVAAQCGSAFDSFSYNGAGEDPPLAPTLGPGPYPELGTAAVIAAGTYYKGTKTLDKSKDVTIQFWMRSRVVNGTSPGYPFSDLDLDNANPKALGGLAVRIYDDGTGKLGTATQSCRFAQQGQGEEYDETRTPYPTLDAWQFVRLVHAGGNLTTCVNGKRAGSVAVPPGRTNSSHVPYLGKNVIWLSQGAFFDGAIDDFRVLSTALPCE